MTLKEYELKLIVTDADAASVLRVSAFKEICDFIADGDDDRVSHLLKGVWLIKTTYTASQILDMILLAIFPRKGWMRCATSVTALDLAKAIGCEQDLQATIHKRWVSIREHDCNDFVIGLSEYNHVASWIDFLVILFGLNSNNDVRTELLRVLNNINRSRNLPNIPALIGGFLNAMSTNRADYSNPDNFNFIAKMNSTRQP